MTHRGNEINADVQAEKGILGSIILSHKQLIKIVSKDLLKGTDFSKKIHEWIFDAMLELYSGGELIDVEGLNNLLLEQGKSAAVGGREYLISLRDNPELISPMNCEKLVETVAHYSIRRRVADIALDVNHNMYDPSKSLNDSIDVMKNIVKEVEGRKSESEMIPIETVATRELERILSGDTSSDSIRVGIPTLDKYTSGFKSKRMYIVAAKPGAGKAQPLDSKVLTLNGFKQMGDIVVGDKLASIDGEESEVLGVFPQGEKDIYRVTFSDGRSTEACGEHLWEVNHKAWILEPTQVVTTLQLKEMLKRKSYINRLRIKQFSGHFGEQIDLPIKPWLLGALLGDGQLTKLSITNSARYMVDRITEEIGGNFKLTCSNDGIDYRIVKSGLKTNCANRIKESLKDLGLYGTKSHNKFVPEMYKNANYETRLAVLQGLLDTDGYVSELGGLEYSSSSRQLAEDVQYLVRSIGGWASSTTKVPFFSYKGERKQGLLSYRIFISHAHAEDLLTFPKKRDRLIINRTLVVNKRTGLINKNREKAKNIKKPVVISVELVRKAQAQCIKVSHPSQLYITDDFVVTHNTSLAVDCLVEASKVSEYPSIFFSLEMSQADILGRLISRQTEISVNAIEANELNAKQKNDVKLAVEQIKDFNIIINDSAGISTAGMKAMGEKIKQEHGGISMIVIDYIQLISSGAKSESRQQDVAQFANDFARMAKELDAPVIVLSQLNRAVDARTAKRPQLSDLRDSGAIEQAAHTVLMLYNKEKQGNSKIMCYIAKNRSGLTGEFLLNFCGDRYMFKDALLPDPRVHRFVAGKNDDYQQYVEEEIF